MRTFNRLNGTLTDANVGGAPKQAARVLAAADDAPKPVKKALARLADSPAENREDAPKEARDYISAKYRAYARGGYKDKSEISQSTKNLWETYNAINEAPKTESQRAWLRQVVGQAQDKLKSRGVHLSNADMQALLWYHEKDLYRKLGVNMKDRAEGGAASENSADYAQAFKKIHERRNTATVVRQ